MTISHAPTRLIEDAAEEYARSCKNKLQPVHMTDAVTAFRRMRPRCAWSDAQLTNLLASKIVAYGFAIFFDGDRQRVCSSNTDVRTFLPSLRAHAYSIVPQRELADEVVERALKLAIQRVSMLSTDADVEIWLFHLIDEAVELPAIGCSEAYQRDPKYYIHRDQVGH